MALTRPQRAEMAAEIISAMREAYEAEGVDGDFDDGLRYLRDDATDAELQLDYDRWCNNS